MGPCPFCKSLNVTGWTETDGNHIVTDAWFECDECFARGPTADTEDEAVLKWNAATDLPDLPQTLPSALADVAAERQRQISSEGWSLEHDDSHIRAEMAMAAAVYALTSFLDTEHSRNTAFTRYWPWDRSWFKPAGGRRDLVRAGALILAEIERLDRKAASTLSRPDGGSE